MSFQSTSREAEIDLHTLAIAAGAAGWIWDAVSERLSFRGDLSGTGFADLRAGCPSPPLLARVTPQSRADFLIALASRDPIAFRLETLNGVATLWRGSWAAAGTRACGLLVLQDIGRGRRDPVTGLLDRRTFLRRANDEVVGREKCALVVADIARFRRLNEALGPSRADDVLRILGERLARSYPPHALPARIGDDEFAVIDENEDQANARLAAVIETPIAVAGLDLRLGVATGRAGCGEGDAHDWLRRADLTVGRAQDDAGPADQAEARSRLILEADAHGALSDGGLEPFYQPIVDLESGRVLAFEALVRWRHPRLGLLQPEDFLASLRATRLIDRLGAFMITAVTAQIAAWRHELPEAHGVWVNVNVTSAEILQPGLFDGLVEALKFHNLPEGALKLELTEHEVMNDPDAAAVVMRRLQAVGIATVVDDFGMGYSSLSYLARLPLETLKIDGYFVNAMGSSPEAAAVVRSIIALGRELGLQIVAEGVEDPATAAALLALGCRRGQGFAYAPALPAAQAGEYLVASCRERNSTGARS